MIIKLYQIAKYADNIARWWLTIEKQKILRKYKMGIKKANWTMIHSNKQILISFLKYLFLHQMPDMNGKRREKENGITHTLNINEFELLTEYKLVATKSSISVLIVSKLHLKIIYRSIWENSLSRRCLEKYWIAIKALINDHVFSKPRVIIYYLTTILRLGRIRVSVVENSRQQRHPSYTLLFVSV